jgi:hypothetical protein
VAGLELPRQMLGVVSHARNLGLAERESIDTAVTSAI